MKHNDIWCRDSGIKNNMDKSKIITTEMDYWRQSSTLTCRDRVTNEKIKWQMGVEMDILTFIEKKHLIWYVR